MPHPLPLLQLPLARLQAGPWVTCWAEATLNAALRYQKRTETYRFFSGKPGLHSLPEVAMLRAHTCTCMGCPLWLTLPSTTIRQVRHHSAARLAVPTISRDTCTQGADPQLCQVQALARQAELPGNGQQGHAQGAHLRLPSKLALAQEPLIQKCCCQQRCQAEHQPALQCRLHHVALPQRAAAAAPQSPAAGAQQVCRAGQLPLQARRQQQLPAEHPQQEAAQHCPQGSWARQQS